jgi:NTE family protein
LIDEAQKSGDVSQYEMDPVSTRAPGGDTPVQGIGLCLSGGGYRAMLFHTGVLLRLAELGYLGTAERTGKDGPMGSLMRISSVSGGSITAGVLGLAWNDLRVDDEGVAERFRELVMQPVQDFASQTTISVWSGIKSMILRTINKGVVKVYRKHLYGTKTLQDLPDYPLQKPNDEIAAAVGASSAFPPFLSPARFKYLASQYTDGSGEGLQHAPFTTKPLLADGGVYDNFGLEAVFKHCKTVIVSNAGGGFEAAAKVRGDWILQSYRVMRTMDNQVRSLRKRILLNAYTNGRRTGAYWSIRGSIEHYPIEDPLDCPPDRTRELANIQTDLATKDITTQRRLINWG